MNQRIILADDHPVVLIGIGMAIDKAPFSAHIVGEANSTHGLILQLKNTPCDLLITDLSMPNGEFPDGVMLIRYIRRYYPTTKIIIITMLNNPIILRTLLNLGVVGLCDKNQPIEQLICAITWTSKGQTYISDTFFNLRNQSKRGETLHQSLSVRELEVIRLIGQNRSGREIAKTLNRSEKTISRHKRMAMQKLGIRFDSELVEFAKSE
ncbi:response regulator transcription factor [Pseudomonas sp. SIMBA_077]